MHNLTELKEILATPQRIVIIPHRKPDADALGSCLALWHFLKKQGHECIVISPTDYPKFLFWMPGHEDVLIYENKNELKSVEYLHEANLIFCLDFSELSRADKMTPALRIARERGDAKFILIDHHRGKEDFADFELWDIEAAATAQLIFDFIEMLDGKELLDIAIASCIYAGLVTDTGSFKYPSTSAKTHHIAAELIDLGLKTEAIHRAIFDNNSVNRIKFLGFALNERLTILPEYRTAFFAISENDLKNFESQTGDTEGIVNYALSIEGVVFAAFFSAQKHYVKVSFRSVGDFAVNEFASQHFKGGGHKNAAGGQLNTSLKKAIQKFKDLLPDYQEALNKVTEIMIS
ncbi:MAG: DHH family phosphoesterase [Flammeovirgaceae bacterium]